MASSLTTSANATATSLLSIITPWVQPPDCETQWSTTTVSWTIESTATFQPIAVSNPAASCNPSGWDRFGPQSRLSFSPGVCPTGWEYHGMAEAGSPAASTALCCQRFFGLRNCVLQSWLTGFDSAASATTSQYTVMMHEAWAVTWAASDTATLTPKLPTLTSSMVVPVWTLGQKIREGEYDPVRPPSSSEYLSHGALFFLMIGMPIIGALMISSCVWCCVRKCRRKRREKKATMAAERNLPVDNK
ncbi:hypothetical protein CI238_09517 [Colletotrichum incanum]|uniref:Uncharacterized protein n=1 Tax=Colletotrichum incanum TaxID=1573173 RepID=A0A166R9M7_COLIC|nr:hypothetical protein CI238_09517 [Colletotrichum incanum]OHW94322.1 hypothetical protein CSPAE12_07072 [Colletotrichum incanum]